MNPKTAITILLLILALSVLTILMIVVNRGVNNSAEKKLNQQFNIENNEDSNVSEKSDLEKEIENKDYSVYPEPEVEKQKDEAKIRLEKLDALRGGSPGPTEEEVNEMSAEEKAQLEAEAQERLDKLNELRYGNVEQGEAATDYEN